MENENNDQTQQTPSPTVDRIFEDADKVFEEAQETHTCACGKICPCETGFNVGKVIKPVTGFIIGSLVLCCLIVGAVGMAQDYPYEAVGLLTGSVACAWAAMILAGAWKITSFVHERREARRRIALR